MFDLSNVPIDDSVGLYFREMGQQGLLSAVEEVQLAKEIEAGREAEILLDRDNLTEEDDWLDMGGFKRNRRSSSPPISSGLTPGLVVSIAKKYRGRWPAIPRS